MTEPRRPESSEKNLTRAQQLEAEGIEVITYSEMMAKIGVKVSEPGAQDAKSTPPAPGANNPRE